MRLIRLNKVQVAYIYEKSMKKDFPDSERKPLAMITKGMDQGNYECVGMVNNVDSVGKHMDETSGCKSTSVVSDTGVSDGELREEIISYAVFVKYDNKYLFDYLAVMHETRNKGLGTIMLGLLKEYFSGADCVFGEVENPAYAPNEEERVIQERRYNFYLRNGYVDTQARCWLFGVHYIILELDMGKHHSKEEIEDIYMTHYKAMLPWILYKTKVKLEK